MTEYPIEDLTAAARDEGPLAAVWATDPTLIVDALAEHARLANYGRDAAEREAEAARFTAEMRQRRVERLIDEAAALRAQLAQLGVVAR